LLAAAGGERGNKEVSGDTPDPGREVPAPLQDIHQLREGYQIQLNQENTGFTERSVCHRYACFS